MQKLTNIAVITKTRPVVMVTLLLHVFWWQQSKMQCHPFSLHSLSEQPSARSQCLEKLVFCSLVPFFIIHVEIFVFMQTSFKSSGHCTVVT